MVWYIEAPTAPTGSNKFELKILAGSATKSSASCSQLQEPQGGGTARNWILITKLELTILSFKSRTINN